MPGDNEPVVSNHFYNLLKMAHKSKKRATGTGDAAAVQDQQAGPENAGPHQRLNERWSRRRKALKDINMLRPGDEKTQKKFEQLRIQAESYDNNSLSFKKASKFEETAFGKYCREARDIPENQIWKLPQINENFRHVPPLQDSDSDRAVAKSPVFVDV